VSEELIQPETPPEPPAADERNAVHPMQRRFLFVDIASQRAKQLRRGAVNRLLAGSPEGSDAHQPHKAERIAMEEVRRGFISYDLPDLKPPQSKAEGQS
jgi:DNA-directed RNA polymerase subunit K/omega